MKTERRHELQTNDLADHLGKAIQSIKPYSSTIVVGLVVLAVIIVGSMLYAKQSAKAAAEAWESYYLATEGGRRDEEKLQQMIEAHPGTIAAEWALLTETDEGLRLGLNFAMRDRKKSREYLNQAVARYKNLVADASQSMVREQATFNLAIAYESLGQLDKATETYGQVSGTLAEIAQKRMKDLKSSNEVKKFYDWFATAELQSPRAPAGGRTPGQRPPFSVDDPLATPFSLPTDIRDPAPSPGGPGDVRLPSFNDPPKQPEPPQEGRPPEPPLDEPAEDFLKPPTDAAPGAESE